MSRLVGLALIACSVIAMASYPPYVKKRLFAAKDERGKHAPEIVVEKWLTGHRPDTKGRVVLVDMWATWCGSCRELIPELNEWSTKFKKDLVVIGISDEDPDKVKRFMEKVPMNYNVGVDPKQRLEQELGVEAIPHVLVITPDGIVRWQGWPGSQEDPLTTDKLSEILRQGTRALH
jgi:thiol-disulfide isomerase/thioredoxin